ncbi:MAG TPA: TraM recognition domain-containing protein [Vicinamibacterales bacterium]|nr:TraM recognition domain-containing protein [Vicinamibacterales bacterium]
MTRHPTHPLVEYRFALSLGLAAVAGAVGLHAWPWPGNDPVLGLIRDREPVVHAALQYAYSTSWFTTPLLVLNVVSSICYIFVGRFSHAMAYRDLPPYPTPERRRDLFLVLGEQHHRTVPTRAAEPRWLVVPERGLYTGVIIVGAIGSGKSSACMYPYVEQLLAYRAGDPERKMAGLILEVKGDFCQHVREILRQHGRADDYIEVSLESGYRYNPLHNELDAYALAYGIATLMTNLFGRGKEPFWQQASTNLVKFVILLHQILDDYVTLFQVYACVINPDKLRAKIAEGDRRFDANNQRIAVDKREHGFSDVLRPWSWFDEGNGFETWTHFANDIEESLKTSSIPYRVYEAPHAPDEVDRRSQFEAVKRWFEDDWMRIEPKLRTSIVEGVSVFLSLFDDNPRVKYTFCPPKDTYDRARNPKAIHGTPLPPVADLIEQGKVVALNFPTAMNPGLARALGTMLKQDFQRAVLNRIQKMTAEPSRPWRSVAFVCDEYQAFATTGENEPSGDEKFFSLARQARCIPIVATQSISSLRSTLPGESWRTLLQGLRTKVFLALSDDFSAQMAAELCGKVERLKPSYTLTEAGQDARVSLMTGRPAAHRTTVSATKTYSVRREYVFEPKVFAELQNGQAIVLPYDGLNPHPPTYCFLKPHYLDVQTSYFDHAATGGL